jgi:ATP-dependent RNA helicase DeaD
MVRFGRLDIRRERVPSLDEVEEAKGNVFFEKLRAILDGGAFHRQQRMFDRLLDQGYASTDIACALMEMVQGQNAEGAGAPAAAAPAPKRFESAPVAKREESAPVQPAAKPPRKERPVVVKAAKPVPEFAKHFVKVAGQENVVPAEPSDAKRAEAPAEKPFGKPVSKPTRKPKFQRTPRTGREPGFTTVRFNVGLQQGVTPAELVGKIAGVTRLPAKSVGAIDLHEDHSLVDVEQSEVELVVNKLKGIRILGVVLAPEAV